jgi:ubiquinone/menaquinone biosynthesis C-methylase UbiE
MTDSETVDRRFDRLASMLRGYELTQMLSVFAALGAPDCLASSPASAAELAPKLGVHAGALHRLLRALSSVRVVTRDDEGRFVLTQLGERLRTDAADSLRPLAVGYGQPWWWGAWGALLHSVQTGEPAFDHVYGCSLHDYLDQHDGAPEIFGDCMTLRSGDDDRMIVDAHDFSSVRRFVDVGGGQGSLATSVLSRYPHTAAVLFDTPAAIDAARRNLAASEVLDRIEFVAGDFFEAVPADADVYVMKNVLHNWGDERAVQILRAVRRACPATGTLLVVQHVIPDDDSPSPAKLLDIALLVLTGGKQRTEAEYRTLLEAASFELVRLIGTASGIGVIVARPVEAPCNRG